MLCKLHNGKILSTANFTGLFICQVNWTTWAACQAASAWRESIKLSKELLKLLKIWKPMRPVFLWMWQLKNYMTSRNANLSLESFVWEHMPDLPTISSRWSPSIFHLEKFLQAANCFCTPLEKPAKVISSYFLKKMDKLVEEKFASTLNWTTWTYGHWSKFAPLILTMQLHAQDAGQELNPTYSCNPLWFPSHWFGKNSMARSQLWCLCIWESECHSLHKVCKKENLIYIRIL